jgi:hypothetical protein
MWLFHFYKSFRVSGFQCKKVKKVCKDTAKNTHTQERARFFEKKEPVEDDRVSRFFFELNKENSHFQTFRSLCLRMCGIFCTFARFFGVLRFMRMQAILRMKYLTPLTSPNGHELWTQNTILKTSKPSGMHIGKRRSYFTVRQTVVRPIP